MGDIPIFGKDTDKLKLIFNLLFAEAKRKSIT